MPFTNIDRNPPMVGAIILEGYEVLANYRNQYVLAQSKTPGNPEPFVVWALDDDGDPHTGSYCTTLEAATKKLFDRCNSATVSAPPEGESLNWLIWQELGPVLQRELEENLSDLLEYKFIQEAIAAGEWWRISRNIPDLALKILGRVQRNFDEITNVNTL